MAESAVISVVRQLIPLVAREATALGGLSEILGEVKNELEGIMLVTKDADERAADEEDVKTWVKQLRLVAYRIEDAIDKYQVLELQPIAAAWPRYMRKVARWSTLVIPRLLLAHVVDEIQTDVREISQRRNRYNLRAYDQEPQASHHLLPRGNGQSSKQSWGDPRVCSLYPNEFELVNIEVPIRDIKKLLDFQLEEPRLSVISLAGMGGLGKTTLARKVYNEKDVQKHFQTRAWITVSETYRTVDILKTMQRHFRKAAEDTPALYTNGSSSTVDRTNKELLIEELREFLEEKRYLVVLDDVWDMDLWKYISRILPYNVKGSKIIITTRLENITSIESNYAIRHDYKLNPLPEDVAWDLFCKKAFCDSNEGSMVCPQELENLSRDMVKKCGGLPLAIAAIGGLLSTKGRDISEWQKLHSSISYEFGVNPHLKNVKRILSLSYHGLPHYLKPCFLYFGIFPEDFPISRMRLTRLWIAEGFIPDITGKTLEEVADEYLTELLHRNLIQVAKVNLYGKAKSFQVHDLMREVILSIGEEWNFSKELDDNVLVHNYYRRLIVKGKDKAASKRIRKSNVRSLFSFTSDDLSMLTCKLYKKFKLLKVLDFEGAQIDHIPEQLGDLLHLKFLSLRRTKVQALPGSIGNLFNLQTLDLKHSCILGIPIEVKKLVKLRHLLVYNDEDDLTFRKCKPSGATIPAGVLGQLQELQKLSFVETDELLKELIKLTALRKLGIKVNEKNSRYLSTLISRAGLLQSLAVSFDDASEFLRPAHLPTFLRCLYLDGNSRLVLPDWLGDLRNVVRLHITRCVSNSSVRRLVESLASLPNLVDLRLDETYEGTTVTFPTNSFPNLKELHLLSLFKLEVVVIESGCMPLLETLRIGGSPWLKMVPSGIQGLKLLKMLEFIDMPPDFMDHIHPGIGRSYKLVEHIPCIQSTRWQGTRFKSYPLPRNWAHPKYTGGDTVHFSTPQPYQVIKMNQNPEAAPSFGGSGSKKSPDKTSSKKYIPRWPSRPKLLSNV